MDLEIGYMLYYKLDMRPVIVIDTSSIANAKVTVRYLGKISGLYHTMIVNVDELTGGSNLEPVDDEEEYSVCDGCDGRFHHSKLHEIHGSENMDEAHWAYNTIKELGYEPLFCAGCYNNIPLGERCLVEGCTDCKEEV